MNDDESFEEASEASLRNAKQFIGDSRLLLQNGSFGHAVALAIFADEELAKAHACWLVSKGLIPFDSAFVEDVFSRHNPKHLLQISHLGSMFLGGLMRKREITPSGILREGLELTQEQLLRDFEQLDEVARERELLRQSAIYVGLKEGMLSTPSQLTKEESEQVLLGVEQRLGFLEMFLEECSKPEGFRLLKSIFDSLPREALQDGEIPIEWFTARTEKQER